MSQASVQYFQKNQIIFYENNIDTSLYKIISGSVAFYIHHGTAREQLIGTSSAPNYFGMMNAMTGRPATYTAVACESTAVLRLPQSQMETFPKSDPGNALALMKLMAFELCAADDRFAQLLLDLHELAGGTSETAQKISALLDQYDVGSERMLDTFVPPEPVELPVQPEQNATEEASSVGQIVIAENTAERGESIMPEPYLEGHLGYPGITRPEDKKYLLEHELTCPNCRQKFTGVRVRASKLIPIRYTAEEHRYDLRVSYSDFEMEWHEIITCPHCYFSALESHFQNKASLYRSRYEEKLKNLRDFIPFDLHGEPTLDAVFAKHYLALVCAPGFTDWRQINAHVWMNLVRLYQDAGEPHLADIAEQKALEAYEIVYKEVDLSESQEQRLCLTMAGVLYARGQKQKAREWAVLVRRGSDDRTAYWNMAEQLIQDVRAELEQ